jgi:hypothetical protein
MYPNRITSIEYCRPILRIVVAFRCCWTRGEEQTCSTPPVLYPPLPFGLPTCPAAKLVPARLLISLTTCSQRGVMCRTLAVSLAQTPPVGVSAILVH